MKTFGTLVKYFGTTLCSVAVAGYLVGKLGYVLKIGGQPIPFVDLSFALISVILGVVFYGIGYIMVKKAALAEKPADPVTYDLKDLSFIEQAIAKTRKRNLWVGVFMLLCGVLFSLVSLADTESVGTGGMVFIIILALLCAVMGIFMLRKYSQLLDIPSSNIYKLIVHDPQTITEISIQVFKSSAGDIGKTINLNLIVNGKIKGTLTVNDKQVELFKQYMLSKNPSVKIS